MSERAKLAAYVAAGAAALAGTALAITRSKRSLKKEAQAVEVHADPTATTAAAFAPADEADVKDNEMDKKAVLPKEEVEEEASSKVPEELTVERDADPQPKPVSTDPEASVAASAAATHQVEELPDAGPLLETVDLSSTVGSGGEQTVNSNLPEAVVPSPDGTSSHLVQSTSSSKSDGHQEGGHLETVSTDEEESHPVVEDDSFTIVSVPTLVSPQQQGDPRVLPPCRIPSMQLFEDNATLGDARREFERETHLSSSSGDHTPRNEEQRLASRRRKLKHADRLLSKMAECLEKERLRAVHQLESEQCLSHFSDIMKFESTVGGLSLRKLIGDSRSTTLTAHLCAEMTRVANREVQRSATAATAASKETETKSGGDREVIDRSPKQDEAVVVEDDTPVASTLCPFASFMFAKELIAENRLEIQAKALLFRAINGLPPHEGCFCHPDTSKHTRAQKMIVSFPRDRSSPFFEPTLWYLTGQILECLEGDVEALAQEHDAEHAALPERLRQAQKEHNLSEYPIYVTAYVMALESSCGNYCNAWSALSIALDPLKKITILGVPMSSVQCLGEAIRCMHGFDRCENFSVWMDSASILEAAGSGLGAPRPSFETTRAAHESFIAVQKGNRIVCDRRTCLVKAAALPEGSSNAAVWCQLGQLIGLANCVEVRDGKKGTQEMVLTVHEETVDVSGLIVNRMDCYALSLAIDPADASTWYRAAISMEDRARVLADPKYQRVDSAVYERALLGPSSNSVDRMTALLYSLTFNGEDPKVWFAVGATLFERNNSLAQPPALQISVPNALLHGRHAPFSQLTQISAQDAFTKCAQLRPSMDPVIQSFISKKTNASTK